MNAFSDDIRFALLQLGLAETSGDGDVATVIANARRYKFSTRERLQRLDRLQAFFAERLKLGNTTDTFDVIRKAYHREAMALHPDRNRDSPEAVDQLKDLNSAYELVEGIFKDAKNYFELSADEQNKIANEAIDLRRREGNLPRTGPESSTVFMSYEDLHARKYAQTPTPQTAPVQGTKFQAASIPRFIRNARLFYLDRDNIIGSRAVGKPPIIYDVIMLSEREFKRARLRLSMEGYGIQELTMSKLTPPYIPQDVREIIVPDGEQDPEWFARLHFQEEFRL